MSHDLFILYRYLPEMTSLFVPTCNQEQKTGLLLRLHPSPFLPEACHSLKGMGTSWCPNDMTPADITLSLNMSETRHYCRIY